MLGKRFFCYLLPVTCYLLLVAACSIERADSGRPPGPPTEADSLALVEADSASISGIRAALMELYERRTRRDWRGVRRSFRPEATIATSGSIQPLDVFLRSLPEGPSREAIYNFRLLHLDVKTYGPLGSAWAVAEGRWGPAPDSAGVYRFVEAFHLYRQGRDWLITSMSSAPEQSGRPLVP